MGTVFIFLFDIRIYCFIVLLNFYFCVGNQAEIATKEECLLIMTEGRTVCTESSLKNISLEDDCKSAGCCWDSDPNNSIQCFSFSGCKAGYYGWRCHLKCHCSGSGTCNRLTGECDKPCTNGYWGVGCLLESHCIYNDAKAEHYVGFKNVTDNNIACLPWTNQKLYDIGRFPDKTATSLDSILNFCRNPDPVRNSAWCYVGRKTKHLSQSWGICTLDPCVCPEGRYGASCVSECHCNDPSEVCDIKSGECLQSGCHPRWSGTGCTECADGYFGSMCQHSCKCSSLAEICDKSIGTCESGCIPGWQGLSCLSECDDGFFGLNCESTCNCLQAEEVCAKESGRCSSGCKKDFGGEGCQIKLPWMARAPTMSSRNATVITIAWNEWGQSKDEGSGPITGYLVSYRAANVTEWSTDASEVFEVKEKRMKVISDLEVATAYEFRVTPIHKSGVVGLPSPSFTASTCGKPPPIYNLESRSSSNVKKDSVTLNLDWNSPRKDKLNCKALSKFNIYTSNSFVNSSLSNFEFYQSVPVRKVAVHNVNVYKSLTVAITLVNDADLESLPIFYYYIGRSGPVEKLQVQGLSTSSILVTWSPPDRSNGKVMKYKYIYRMIRSGGCANKQLSSIQQSWSPYMEVGSNETGIEILGLSLFSFYQITLWPETQAGKGQDAVANGSTEAAEPLANLTLTLVSVSSESAVITWQSVDCKGWNGEFKGYMYELYAGSNRVSLGFEAAEFRNESSVYLFRSGLLNQTKLELDQLIPYLNYSLFVWFANHQFNGVKSLIPLETEEDKPPAPKNVIVESKSSQSLHVQWEVPNPPHGVITHFCVRYFAVENGSSHHFSIQMEGSDVSSFNITGLRSFVPYGIEVRASTRIGDGPWSNLIKETTEESFPSEPINLVNTSRTSKELTLQWQEPLVKNGHITFYFVKCAPITPFGIKNAVPVERVVSPPALNFTVEKLNPGINYGCKVSASTKKGQGQSVSILLWTEPEISFNVTPPLLHQRQEVDNLIIVDLQPTGSIDYMEDPDSIYRVVVELLDENYDYERRKRRKREVSPTPCGLTNAQLVAYSLATSRGLRCYIAAEIPRLEQTINFVVGDNKTYGGYLNARLNPDVDHDVWFGLVVTVDGVTVSSYSKTAQSPKPSNRLKTTKVFPSEMASFNNSLSISPITGAIIGSLAALAILAIIVFLLVFKHLRKRNAGSANVVAFDSMTDSISELNRRLLPTEPYEEKVHHPIPVSQLWNYVVPKRRSDYDNLRTEFNEFRKDMLYKAEVAKRPGNKGKNRYHNIFPYDHSRVVLDLLPDDPHSDYINANYIDGYKRPKAFVAAQGPVEGTIDDTWRMIWQLNSRIVIMVTNLQEGCRQKCKQYWPDSGSQQYEEIVVESHGSEEYADYIIRTFEISKKGDKRMIKQFHFTTWPDHGIPEHPTSLLEFRKKVRAYADEELQIDSRCGPHVVHCSAGVGRTGCYITLDCCLDQAQEEGHVDVFNFVKKMREDRVNMIQTVEQYIFVYEALLEALQAGVTSIPCSDFRSRYAELMAINPETEQPYLVEEFELLKSTNQLYIQDGESIDALLPENVSKNRDQKILPNDHSRPRLNTLICKSDYINAVFVDGYKQRNAYIVTQSPIPSTIVDFWAMFTEHKCGVIISLDDPNSKEDNEVYYFPTSQTENLDASPFSIKLISSEYSPYFDQQEYLVSCSAKSSRSRKDVTVKRFRLKSWTTSYDKSNNLKKANLPNRSSVLALLGALEKWQQQNKSPTVVVHCRDGATHSGIFCAASYMVEKLKIEHEVDVFFSIRHVRVNRPQFIPDLTQYTYLYDLAIDYLDCFDTYANFETSI